MANTPRPHILGQFQDIGEQIVSEIKQIPKDVGQAALESVGVSTGGTKQAKTAPAPGAAKDAGSKWQEIDHVNEEKIKKQIARSALQELTSPSAAPKEKSIWEKLQDEDAQKEQSRNQQQQAQSNALPMPKGKTKQGAMGRVNKSKQQGNEMKVNMKQD